MKRAILEWGVIFSTGFACICGIYWVVSETTDSADFHLRIGPAFISAHDGKALFCDDPNTPEWIDGVVEGGWMDPQPINRFGWQVPGLKTRFVRFENGWVVWTLSVSILYVAIVCALLAIACYRCFRRHVRRTRKRAVARQQERNADLATWPG